MTKWRPAFCSAVVIGERAGEMRDYFFHFM